MTAIEHEQPGLADLLHDYELPALADGLTEGDALALANAYLGALRQVEADRASAEAEMRATVKLVQAEHARRVANLEVRETYLSGVLERVYPAFPPTGKTRSRKLLAGTIGLRRRPPRVTIDTPEDVLAWARTVAPAIVSTPPIHERVLVTDLTAWLESQATPVEVPGAHVEPAADEFYARAL